MTTYDSATTTYDSATTTYDAGGAIIVSTGTPYEIPEALAIKASKPKGTEDVVSANALAGTKGQTVVGALNILAGNAKNQYRDLAGVLNQLAGTSGLEAQGAASRWAGR